MAIPHDIRVRLDPQYALDDAIKGYNRIMAREKLAGLSEGAAKMWFDDVNAQIRYIESLYAKWPQLLAQKYATSD